MNLHCKNLLIFASAFGVSGIIMASIGAHGAEQLLVTNQLLDSFNKAVDYSQYNSIALIGLALTCQLFDNADFKSKFHWAGYCIVIGGLIFQTSLFIYSLSGSKAVTVITPFGGMLMIAGWLIVGIAALMIRKPKTRSE